MNLLKKDITCSLYLFIISFIVFCTQSFANPNDSTINKDSLIVVIPTPKTTIYISNNSTLIINNQMISSDIKLVYLKNDSTAIRTKKSEEIAVKITKLKHETLVKKVTKKAQKPTLTSTKEKKNFRKLPYHNGLTISQLNFVKGISTTNKEYLKKVINTNQKITLSLFIKDEMINNNKNKTANLPLFYNTFYSLNYAMRPPPFTIS